MPFSLVLKKVAEDGPPSSQEFHAGLGVEHTCENWKLLG